MREFVCQRLQAYGRPGSMGVVTNTRFTRCFWPKLDQPTKLFADGSKGLEILGSARNVIFPPDTVFLDYYPDALYPAELAVLALSPGRRGLANLSDAEVAIWRAAYDAAVAKFPPTHAVHNTRDDVHFLVHKELVSARSEKARFEVFLAPITKQEAIDIAEGKLDAEAKKADIVFTRVDNSKEGADATYHTLAAGKMVDITTMLEAPRVDDFTLGVKY